MWQNITICYYESLVTQLEGKSKFVCDIIYDKIKKVIAKGSTKYCLDKTWDESVFFFQQVVNYWFIVIL